MFLPLFRLEDSSQSWLIIDAALVSIGGRVFIGLQMWKSHMIEVDKAELPMHETPKRYTQ